MGDPGLTPETFHDFAISSGCGVLQEYADKLLDLGVTARSLLRDNIQQQLVQSGIEPIPASDIVDAFRAKFKKGNVGIYWDYESVRMDSTQTTTLHAISAVRDRIGVFGPIKVLNLYVPPDMITDQHGVALQDAGAQIITVPRIRKRDSLVAYADKPIIVDSLVFAYQTKDPVVVIVSRDSDFAPLLSKLQMMGARAVMVTTDDTVGRAVSGAASVNLSWPSSFLDYFMVRPNDEQRNGLLMPRPASQTPQRGQHQQRQTFRGGDGRNRSQRNESKSPYHNNNNKSNSRSPGRRRGGGGGGRWANNNSSRSPGRRNQQNTSSPGRNNATTSPTPAPNQSNDNSNNNNAQVPAAPTNQQQQQETEPNTNSSNNKKDLVTSPSPNTKRNILNQIQIEDDDDDENEETNTTTTTTTPQTKSNNNNNKTSPSRRKASFRQQQQQSAETAKRLSPATTSKAVQDRRQGKQYKILTRPDRKEHQDENQKKKDEATTSPSTAAVASSSAPSSPPKESSKPVTTKPGFVHLATESRWSDVASIQKGLAYVPLVYRYNNSHRSSVSGGSTRNYSPINSSRPTPAPSFDGTSHASKPSISVTDDNSSPKNQKNGSDIIYDEDEDDEEEEEENEEEEEEELETDIEKLLAILTDLHAMTGSGEISRSQVAVEVMNSIGPIDFNALLRRAEAQGFIETGGYGSLAWVAKSHPSFRTANDYNNNNNNHALDDEDSRNASNNVSTEVSPSNKILDETKNNHTDVWPAVVSSPSPAAPSRQNQNPLNPLQNANDDDDDESNHHHRHGSNRMSIPLPRSHSAEPPHEGECWMSFRLRPSFPPSKAVLNFPASSLPPGIEVRELQERRAPKEFQIRAFGPFNDNKVAVEFQKKYFSKLPFRPRYFSSLPV